MNTYQKKKMFEEDYCPRSSPDLWKDSLGCQDDLETQASNDTVKENFDNEFAEGQMRDETTDDPMNDSDATRASSDDDMLAIENNYPRNIAKSTRKSRSSSASPRNSQPVNPVLAESEIDSQVPGGSNMLTQRNDSFRIDSKSSRNRACNKNDGLIISETSESDSDADENLLCAKKTAPSQKNNANSENHINSSDDDDDVDDSFFNKAQTLLTRTASQSLKDKENLENDVRMIPSSKDIETNIAFLDDEMQEWLLKNNNYETQWVKNRTDLHGRLYTDWEDKCMLSYLIRSNSMNRWNLKKTWDSMKKQYQYLPQRTTKSLINHFDVSILPNLKKFKLPDKVIETIKSTNRKVLRK